MAALRKHLQSSALCADLISLVGKSTEELFDKYDCTLRDIFDKLIPIYNVTIKMRPLFPWFDDDCNMARRHARSLERRFRSTHSDFDRQAWLRQLESKRTLLQCKQSTYWSNIISKCGGSSRKLWRSLTSLIKRDDKLQVSET